MVVNNINNIGGIGPVKGPESRPVKPPEAKPKPFGPEGQPVDRAELAKTRREHSRLLSNAKLVLDSLPDVRADKIKSAKKRLKEGYYDRPEARAAVAAKILSNPESRPLPELTPEQAADLKSRLNSGFYDTPEARDKIARGMLDDAVE